MQKNSNFVKINKYLPLVCACIVLIISIYMADLHIYTADEEDSDHENGSSSMYRQLECYTETEDTETENVQKMNNSETENANRACYSPQNANGMTSFPELSETVLVLDTKSNTVNVMDLEDYVLCVLVAEMPQSFDMQALMAQAVAVRSYTVRCMLCSSKHKNAHVCSDHRCCQAMYMPWEIDFDITRAAEAVRATQGIIAVYDNEPILAAYHASSYIQTKSAKEVWGGSVPYLVPVFAPEGAEKCSSTLTLDRERVLGLFKDNGLGGDAVFLSDNDGICVGALSSVGKMTPRQLRNVLGLRSDTFSVSSDADTFTFTSYGYGHGVGMSQHGADALAKNGFSFYEILKHYYTGISFAFLE